MLRKKTFVRLVSQLGICVALLPITEFSQADSFPLPLRFSTNAYLSSSHGQAEADLMLPLMGDTENNFYINPHGAYTTNNLGTLDLGVGYRWMQNESIILGAYVYGGYNRAENNARLWITNPGLEILGSGWDAHLNAYFPSGKRNFIKDGWSDPRFSEHSEYAYKTETMQSAGKGADIKLGYQLFPDSSLKAYVGSYYFKPEGERILGGAAGLEYWLSDTVKVFSGYTYDNLRHSTFALGLGLELGGTHTNRVDAALEERMTDPTERNLGTLGRGSTVPTRINTQRIGNEILVHDNIAFMSQTGKGIKEDLTIENCTFEHPCGPGNIDQKGIDNLNKWLPKTIMYFNGGSYKGDFNLNPGQSMYSRTADYKQNAVGEARTTFNGGITLDGGNTLQNIVVLPTDKSKDIGIEIIGEDNRIIGTQIGSDKQRFATAVNIDGKTLYIEGAQLFASKYGVNKPIQKIPVDSFTMKGSYVNVTGSEDDAMGVNLGFSDSTKKRPHINAMLEHNTIEVAGGKNVHGVRLKGDDSTFTLRYNTIILNSGLNTDATGFDAGGYGDTVTLEHNTINVTGGDNSYGVYIWDDYASKNTLTNNLITVNGGKSIPGSEKPGSYGIWIKNDDHDVINTLSDNIVNVIGDEHSEGLHVNSSGSTKMYNNFINLKGGKGSVGVEVFGSGELQAKGGDHITVTGDDALGIMDNIANSHWDNVDVSVTGDGVTGFKTTRGKHEFDNGHFSVHGTGKDVVWGFDARVAGSNTTLNNTSFDIMNEGGTVIGFEGGGKIEVHNGKLSLHGDEKSSKVQVGSDITIKDMVCELNGNTIKCQ